MTAYRRDRTPGACWFFTLNLADRQQSLLIEHIDLLRSSFRRCMQRHPWQIDAIVILPDHLHALCTLPADDSDFALRWRLIKTGFSHALPHGERISASRINKGERGIWQRRYWEHRIRDSADFRLYPPQPSKTRPCAMPRRLAVVFVSSVCERRDIARRLGWRRAM